MDKVKVHIFWEGHKILQNLHLTFDSMYCSQKLGEDFEKFCGLLRIYELYCMECSLNLGPCYLPTLIFLGQNFQKIFSVKMASNWRNVLVHQRHVMSTLFHEWGTYILCIKSNPEISNILPSCSLLTFMDLEVKLKVLLKFKLNFMIIIRVDDENP